MIRVGRFAPSPTGDLHFGSLVAAVASYLDVKARGGRWLVRVENLDPPREVAGSAERILGSLRAFGLRSDEAVLFQGERRAAHQAAMQHLLDKNLAYWCGCSRTDLPPSGVYPGTCRNGLPPGKTARAVRIKTQSDEICFIDRIRGRQRENLRETVGDFIIWRADGLPAYQLAVAVDDAFQGITDVVRGSDLLASTARQIWVLERLGLPLPTYAHHPVATSADNIKLSKRLASDPVATAALPETLARALRFLGQPCPAGLSLSDAWQWALKHWDLSAVPNRDSIILEP